MGNEVMLFGWPKQKFWQNLQILQNVLFHNPIEIEWKIECMFFFSAHIDNTHLSIYF